MHLKNRRPKCKMHTQEIQLTRFFVFSIFFIFQLIYKETEPTVFQNELKPNRTRSFSQTEQKPN